MAAHKLIYGRRWEADVDPLEVEMEMIRQEGYFTNKSGQRSGLGLVEHYKRMFKLCWPEDDNHRWQTLILENIIANRITVLMGSRDSGKTDTTSKWAICDYWCHPNDTLTLMTSTDTRGLELRVWGHIKDLFERAKARYPWLVGNVVDAKHGVFTDDLLNEAESRDMRKGIIGVPVLSSQGEYMGMALKNFAGIKQKRRRLIGDECFPAGSLVDTTLGPKRIETIVPGDKVLNAIGCDNVIGVRRSFSSSLCRITTKDRRQFVCTQNHKLLTQKGWIKSIDINREHYILSAYEAMCIMRSDVFSFRKNEALSEVLGETKTVRVLRDNIGSSKKQFDTAFLQSELLKQMETTATRISSEALHRIEGQETVHRETQVASRSPGVCRFSINQNEKQQPDAGALYAGSLEIEGGIEETPCWKRNRTYHSRKDVDENIGFRASQKQFSNSYRHGFKVWIPHSLQSGYCNSSITFDRRSRWSKPLQSERPRARFKKEQPAYGSWVESCEVLKPSDFEADHAGRNGVEVFNLHVEKHHTYSVEGFCVSNCQFIPRDYLKVLDSLDKGDFKASFLGNPIADNGKALDTVSEPKCGWLALGEVSKTTVWENKYNGVTINLVGTDSPNFDPETLNRYSYLVDQSDVERVSKRPGGKDSIEWWSQIMGVRKAGAVSNRVLTVAEIEQYGGFGDNIWLGSATIKVYAIDAGFGGDPCVRTWAEFGKNVDDQDVIVFGDQKVIPILVGSKFTAEEQIANYAKIDCAALGIPASNVFFDAGMYATLAVQMSRTLSPEVNAVNFGGTATSRPVDNETYVYDDRTKERRLKTCYEHYSKFVTELWFSVRLLTQCRQARKWPREAAEEFGRRLWDYVSNDRYELETKDEYKLRNGGESPNAADSLSIVVEGARRLGFEIKSLLVNSDSKPVEDWLSVEHAKYRRNVKKTELQYK